MFLEDKERDKFGVVMISHHSSKSRIVLSTFSVFLPTKIATNDVILKVSRDYLIYESMPKSMKKSTIWSKTEVEVRAGEIKVSVRESM